MCGIIGITSETNIVKELVDGLKRLEYRGYDSAGFGLIDCKSNILYILKDVGKIDHVVRANRVLSYCARTGIAHTRWATHGQPNKVNSHPHVDCNGRIAVVHNGIIKNFSELKAELLSRGHIFVSETDTEVIPHFLEEKIANGLTMLEALRELVARIEGAYALAIIYSEEPLRIYFAKRLSPLIIGLGKGFNVVSSDIPSFLKLTRDVIILEDGEIGYISPFEVYIEKSGRRVDFTNRIRRVGWSISDAEKGGYPHFMLKEILEQPQALQETIYGLFSDESIVKAALLLNNSEKIYITGAGTSFHASLYASYLANILLHKNIIPFIASEYEVFVKTADSSSLLIAVSQSGETIDTLQAVRAFKERGAKIVAVSNVIGSAIPRESDIAVYTRAGPEIGVAATKTFLTQIAALERLLIESSRLAGIIYDNEARRAIDELGSAPRLVQKALNETTAVVERLAWTLKSSKNMYILSRGVGFPLALEAALKIKEVSYIHAEAYPAGESKHGPIALVEEKFPVIFIGSPPYETMIEKLQGNIMEMKSRGAYTVLIAPRAYQNIKGVDVNILVDEDVSPITLPYIIIPPLQLLAYRLAVILGRDPDKPRNLAKTVTVE